MNHFSDIKRTVTLVLFWSLLCSHKIAKHASYISFVADAVGQSLSTRPDLIGSEIAEVRDRSSYFKSLFYEFLMICDLLSAALLLASL